MHVALDFACGTDESTSSVFKHWAAYPIDDVLAVRQWLTERFGEPSDSFYNIDRVQTERWMYGMKYIWFRNLSDRTMYMLNWS